MSGRQTLSLRQTTDQILRDLRGSRGALASVIAVLTIAIAAAALVLAVVDGTALQPLPFGAPDRLVFVEASVVNDTWDPASPRDYMLWRERSTSLDGIAAGSFGTATIRVARESLSSASVTTNFFDVLQVRPALGRAFVDQDARPGAPATIVLSYDAWARTFGSDPQIIGRKIDTAKGPEEIIGVLPRDVRYPLKGHPIDVFKPLPLFRVPYTAATNFLTVLARLKPGVTAAQAQAEMSTIARAQVTPLHAHALGSAKTWLLLSLAAVGFVLLIAFLTATTLLVTRTIAASRDIATQEALGASRARLAMARAAIGVALAAVSTIGGLLLARAGLANAIAVLPADLALVSRIHLDARVIGTILVVGVLVGGAFLSAPGWLIWRHRVGALLTSSGSAVIGDRRHSRWLGALQVGCLAAAYVLAVASALVVSSALQLLRSDLGFDWRHLFVVHYQRPLPSVSPDEQFAIENGVRRELLSRIQRVRGIVSVAAIRGLVPLTGPGGEMYSIGIDGMDHPGLNQSLLINAVTPEYFQTMQMKIIRGRGFLPSDAPGSTPVLILNDVGAKRFFGEEDPLGHVASFRGERAIVGVVEGLRYDGPETPPGPELYIPVAQDPVRPNTWAVGTLVIRANNPQVASHAVLDAMGSVASTGDAEIRFLDDAFGRLTAVQRYVARILSFFGMVALAATGLGIYSAMSLYVAQQTRAIGLRIALGATPGRIMQMLFKQALALTAIGTAVGIVGLLAIARVLGSQLVGARMSSVGVNAAVLVTLALVTLAGALRPARIAAAQDPLRTLRE